MSLPSAASSDRMLRGSHRRTWPDANSTPHVLGNSCQAEAGEEARVVATETLRLKPGHALGTGEARARRAEAVRCPDSELDRPFGWRAVGPTDERADVTSPQELAWLAIR